MRSFIFTTVATLLLAGAAPALAADCAGKADVEAAFTKRLGEKAWRTSIASKSSMGDDQSDTYDFLPPDRMYRKVVTKEQTIETVGIGKWAWTNIGGGYSELQPQFAQMVISRVQAEFANPKVSTEFKCLGTVAFEGKDYTGYQTAPEQQEGKTLARTILIDAKSGLPAFNIVSAPDLKGEVLIKETYTYPTDISIEKP